MVTYDQIVTAEVAVEILNDVRGRVQTRIYEFGDSDPGLSRRYTIRAKELWDLQDSIRASDSARNMEIIELWGRRLENEDRFWRELWD